MKVQIRRGVFETNSSSMHSLAIFKDEGYTVEDGKPLYFTPEEIAEEIAYYTYEGVFNGYKYRSIIINRDNDEWYFGRWPCYVLTTFCEKLVYTYSAGRRYDEPVREVFEKILMEFCPVVESVNWPESVGTDDYNVVVPTPFDFTVDGFFHVDEYEKAIREFLTDKTKVIISDGDEYATFYKLLGLGIFDTSKLTEPDGSPYYNKEAREFVEESEEY